MDQDENVQQEILERARAGQREALEAVFADCLDFVRDKVRQLAPNQARDRHSDLVQSAILQAINDFKSFRGSSRLSFLAWLGTVVRNTMLRKKRYWGAGKRAAATSDSDVNLLSATTRTPSNEAIRVEYLVTLASALQTLEPADRDLIEMRVLNELPYQEIAELTGKSEAAARMAVSRARASLSLALGRLQAPDA
ncbi:MAG: sigma-70 family RNA polymerase sigma factor [Planctomycetes bacterium]|nr:sigma-70 family RNA polymerase sigma factor [Planctomycetota bacterium]